jgi:hypothetical protein
LNYDHPFPRVSGYHRVSDIMEVDITEFRVYLWALMVEDEMGISDA